MCVCVFPKLDTSSYLFPLSFYLWLYLIMVSNKILNKCVKKQRKPTNLNVTEDPIWINDCITDTAKIYVQAKK